MKITDKDICKYFLSCLDDPNHKSGQLYKKLKETYLGEIKKGDYYKNCNSLERQILNIPLPEDIPKKDADSENLIDNIKQLSIELQGSKTSEGHEISSLIKTVIELLKAE